MKAPFASPLAEDLAAFLKFKRGLGYLYSRSEYTLREFDRFLASYCRRHRYWRVDRSILAWLESKPERKGVSTAMEVSVLRQFCRHLRRRRAHLRHCEPLWPRLPTSSTFTPNVLSRGDILRLLRATAALRYPHRRVLYRALILLLYCTGIRFGEALRLRIRDVDTRAGVLFIAEFKGRARWVPIHKSLLFELKQYLTVRRSFAPAGSDERFFVGGNRRTLPVSTAHAALCRLFRRTGLKPATGRVGPRPYDFRHSFAVERLTQWHRRGVDLHARLPWLSAYMGHTDILGTETYLTATPKLLALAGSRFRSRFRKTDRRGA
jgi:integrase